MLPRNPADWRTILWATLMPVVLVAQIVNPRLMPYLCPLSFYFAMAAGTMAHNHNHSPTFGNRKVNGWYANWISVFYGYPSFAWVPTHNLNHHKHVNRAGDATITWRITNRNTWWIAVSYFFVSAYYQATPIQEYITKAKGGNGRLYRQIRMQYAVWIGALVAAFCAAVAFNGLRVGAFVFVVAFVLPSLFGPWCMMWFNYMQHVHCDPWSRRNHSRNITGRLFNFLVFNAGLHTVHHDNPGAHWSELPALHAKIEAEIHPRLKQPSFWWFVFRSYVLTAFLPSLETKQIGRAPFDGEPGAMTGVLRTDSVEALEAGNNAQMA